MYSMNRSVGVARVPRLSIMFNNQVRIEAIIDSGSELNAMSESLVSRLKFNKIKFNQIPVTNLRLLYGNGKCSGKITKQIFVEMHYGSNKGILNAFIVPGICVDLVLGMDFLIKSKAIIDFYDNSISFRKHEGVVEVEAEEKEPSPVKNLKIFVESFPYDKIGQGCIYTNELNLPNTTNAVDVSPNKHIVLENNIKTVEGEGIKIQEECESKKRKNFKKREFPEGGNDIGIQSNKKHCINYKVNEPLSNKNFNAKGRETYKEKMKKRVGTGQNRLACQLNTIKLEPPLYEQFCGKVDECYEIQEDERRNLFNLLNEYEPVFDEFRHPICNKYTHKFEFTDNIEHDFKSKTYPVPVALREDVNQEINRMIAAGIVSASPTKFLTPLVVVKKPDGSIRLCGDYRNLNKYIVYSKQAPEKINDLITRMHGKKYFTQLDLRASFHQVPIQPEQRKYFGFKWRNQTFTYNVTPFGTSDSLSALLNALNCVFQDDDLDDVLFPYVDDLVLATETFEEHLKYLRIILQRLHEANMGLKLSKCHFIQKQFKFVGFIVDRDGVRPDPAKVEKLREYKTPRNQKELRGFLGFLQFYSRFFYKFSDKIKPFLHLTSSKRSFYWNDDLQKRFEEIKESLIQDVLLSHPDPNKEFFLVTDASDMCASAVLFQLDENQEPKLLYFFSKTFSGAELNYFATEKEFYSIVLALNFFESLICYKKITIITDCKALVYIKSAKYLSPRFTRWCLKLQQFKYEIKHIPGKDNPADILSRLVNFGKKEDTVVPLLVQNKKKIKITDPYEEILREVQELHKNDDRYKVVRERVNNDENVQISNDLITIKEVNRWKIYLLPEEVEKLTYVIHERYGHIGVQKTYRMMRRRFVGPYFFNTVKKVILRCHICQVCKPANRVLLGETKTVLMRKPNLMISGDYLGPMVPTTRGFKHLLVLTDNFSMYTRVYPCRKPTASFTIKCLEDWINQNGIFQSLLLDNAKYFVAKSIKRFAEEKNFHLSYLPLYHPRANLSEGRNKTIVHTLRILAGMKHNTWYKYLGEVHKVLNETINTLHGFTPNELFLKEPNTYEWEKVFDNEVVKSNNDWTIEEKYEIVAEKRRRDFENRIRNRKKGDSAMFEINQKVLVKVPQLSNAAHGESGKLLPVYEGPYIVSCIKGQSVYEVKNPDNGKIRGIFHVTKLKKYYD